MIKDTLNLTISERFAVALAGIAKVYVGQIVEAGITMYFLLWSLTFVFTLGLDFMEEKNETGPLKPKHIREAERRIKRLTDYALKYPFWSLPDSFSAIFFTTFLFLFTIYNKKQKFLNHIKQF